MIGDVMNPSEGPIDLFNQDESRHFMTERHSWQREKFIGTSLYAGGKAPVPTNHKNEVFYGMIFLVGYESSELFWSEAFSLWI